MRATKTFSCGFVLDGKKRLCEGERKALSLRCINLPLVEVIMRARLKLATYNSNVLHMFNDPCLRRCNRPAPTYHKSQLSGTRHDSVRIYCRLYVLLAIWHR